MADTVDTITVGAMTSNQATVVKIPEGEGFYISLEENQGWNEHDLVADIEFRTGSLTLRFTGGDDLKFVFDLDAYEWRQEPQTS